MRSTDEAEQTNNDDEKEGSTAVSGSTPTGCVKKRSNKKLGLSNCYKL